MYLSEVKKHSISFTKRIRLVLRRHDVQIWTIGIFALLLTFSLIAFDLDFTADNNRAGFLVVSGVERLKNHDNSDINDNINGVDAKATLEALNRIDYFFNSLEKARNAVEKNYSEKEFIMEEFLVDINKKGFNLSKDQAVVLLLKLNIDDFATFKNTVKDELNNLVNKGLYEEGFQQTADFDKISFLGKYFNKDLKEIGDELLRTVITISDESKIGDSKLTLKTRYLIGLTVLLLLMLGLLVMYLKLFLGSVIKKRSDVLLISTVVISTLFIARLVYSFSPYAIPVLVGIMLVSILVDLRLSIIINLIVTALVTLVIGEDIRFIFMTIIGGSFAAFFVAKNGQKTSLLLNGVLLGIINATVILFFELSQNAALDDIFYNCLIAFLNGLVSVILTVGLLPFIESYFSVITPSKLLELMNPNQPLLKRLLIEAPGTYHHSLMVGNLSEAAAESIGANSMIARVGAYFHDIGKLSRPNFFMENQLNDNPHDRMTPSLSSLVIISHTSDGLELAKTHKIPVVIRKIIEEHHGTTLTAYFYHKAKNSERGESVTEESFRYHGPKPSTKESAVVMIADSVEAAVRSLNDKSEGKIEGLIRKIIRDKLDDGQLDGCSLTFKDLDKIAKAFIQVFDGYFHERESYPVDKDNNVDKKLGDKKFAVITGGENRVENIS